MAVTTTERTNLIKLVVGLFNAAPGSVYLNDVVNVFEATGRSYSVTAQVLATTGAYKQLNPDFQTAEEFAAAFLTPLGLQANTTAVDYVVGKFNAGVSKGQIVADALTALEGATGTEFAAAKAILANKAQVAEYYSVTKNVGQTDLSILQSVLTGVTDDATTVTAAKASIDGGGGGGGTGSGGRTIELTINQDSGPSFTTGATNDTFTATAVTNPATGNLNNTLQSVDAIDGGAGTDTLTATLAGAVDVAPTIKNIENVIARFANAAAGLDLINATGITSVTVADSTTTGAVKNVGSVATLVVKNQNNGVSFDKSTATTLGLTVDTVGKATGVVTVDLGTTTAAAATTANLTLNNAFVKVDSTVADKITTLSVAATGTNVLTLTDSAATITSATITGAGSVDLTGGIFSGGLTKLDASAATGAVKAEIQSTKAATVTTGAGADVIRMDAVVQADTSVALGAGNDQLYAGAKLASFNKGADGGEGTDIINITDGATLTAVTAKYITNFETLDVSGGTGNYDVSLNSFATVQIDEAVSGALTGAIDFKNAPDTFTLNVASKAKTNADFATGFGTTVTGKDYAGTTALGTAESFALIATFNDGNKDDTADGNINANVITVAGVENLSIETKIGSTDGGTTGAKDSAYTLTANLVAAAAEKLTITGAGTVDLTPVTTIGVLTAVDASAATGGVKLDLSTHAKSVAYTGSQGVDTYKGSTVGDVIYTGKGADVVTITAGVRDTIVLKAATDAQLTDTSKDGKITVAADTGFDSITGFTVGAASTDDRLDLTNLGFSGAQRGLTDVSASVVAATDLTSKVDLFATPAGDRGVAYSVIAGDTYVFVDANKDGDFKAADDLVIKLVGVATLSETSINF